MTVGPAGDWIVGGGPRWGACATPIQSLISAMPLMLHSLARIAAPLPLFLAAFGGVGHSGAPAAAECSLAEQKASLRDTMRDWYFWYRFSPSPELTFLSTVDSYFGALLYGGTDATFPPDHWSGSESTEAFNCFIAVQSFGLRSLLGQP